MLLRTQIKFAFIAIHLIAAGCATFKPGMRYQDLTQHREFTVKESQEGLEVSVEEFVSKNKSVQAFDADLATHGILALLLKVQNNGTRTYSIGEQTISASLGTESLPLVSGKKAASQAADSEYVGKALFWTLMAGVYAGPIAAAASAAHTRAVNERIEEYFDTMSFNYSVLKPNQSAAGFLYFQLPKGTKKLENLRVEATPFEDGTADQLSYKLVLPTLDISGAAATPPAGQNNGSQP